MAERDDEDKEEVDKHESKKTDDYDIENYQEPFDTETSAKPGKQRKIMAVALASVLLLGIIPLVYFQFDFDNDSDPLQKELSQKSEDILSSRYDVGDLGSEHAHAALVVFVNGEKINFGLPQFQLQSSYVHFENKNPYLVHRHATGVPLAMLFDSIGMKVTQNCIILNNDKSQDSGFMKNQYCSDIESGKDLKFFVNGIQYESGISEYVFDHEDRILVSYGADSAKIIQEQIDYLESLRIYDVPDEDRQSEPSSNISI